MLMLIMMMKHIINIEPAETVQVNNVSSSVRVTSREMANVKEHLIRYLSRDGFCCVKRIVLNAERVIVIGDPSRL